MNTEYLSQMRFWIKLDIKICLKNKKEYRKR